LSRVLAPGLGLILAAPALGQAPPPPPGAVAQVAGDPSFAPTARKMGDEVRRLADDIATDLGQNPQAQHLIEDARELAQTLDEFRKGQKAGANAIQTRQDYSGIHSSWQHLRAHLTRQGATSQVIERDLARIDALDTQVGQALGLNPLPANYYAAGANAPAGIAQTQRLARSLVDRAEGLALTIQTDLGQDPNAVDLVDDARALTREADAWHDGLTVNTAPAAAARSFGPVDAIADRIERYVTTRRVPARVASAWQSFASVEVLIQRDLGLTSPPPTVVQPAPNVNVQVVEPNPAPVVVQQPAPTPVTVVTAPAIAPLADQLVEQTAAFVQVFGPTARIVPQGQVMLADAQQLLAAATAFRENVARGADANALAFGFRDVDAIWTRLARRVNRIARGRSGPNIQQVSKIGGTCDQIHGALGMPGFPPVLAPF
jgi:hypothetical protein